MTNQVDLCSWCDEPVLQSDDRSSSLQPSGLRRWQHLECSVRSVSGSAAHLNHTCSCYVPGSTDSDHPALSRRQAARAAFLAYTRIHPLPG
jgi:hypothetical protein